MPGLTPSRPWSGHGCAKISQSWHPATTLCSFTCTTWGRDNQTEYSCSRDVFCARILSRMDAMQKFESRLEIQVEYPLALPERDSAPILYLPLHRPLSKQQQQKQQQNRQLIVIGNNNKPMPPLPWRYHHRTGGCIHSGWTGNHRGILRYGLDIDSVATLPPLPNQRRRRLRLGVKSTKRDGVDEP